MITHIGLRFLMPFIFIAMLSSLGACSEGGSPSTVDSVVPKDSCYTSGVNGQKGYGLLTFSDSPYGTLVDGSFRNLPAGKTSVAMAKSCEALSDQLKLSPNVDLPTLGQLTTANGVGEIHILIPTASDRALTEQLRGRESLALTNEYLGHRTVIACGDMPRVNLGSAGQSSEVRQETSF